MKISFTKCHGSGNDFILVDGISQGISFSGDEFAAFTRRVCDRKNSIGADGTLFILPSEKADARMRIFNADGSEPEMCGNGIRCLARMVIELLGKGSVTIETMTAVLSCRREKDIFPGVISTSVLIDNVSFVSPDFPFAFNDDHINKAVPDFDNEIKFSVLSLGNPHLTSYSPRKTDTATVKLFGKKANEDKGLFPNGSNVTFFTLLEPQTIYTQTYERGVGLTSSCGTAMSASSITACRMGICEYGEWINVYNDGGMVRCLVNKTEDTAVRLLGNATFEYSAIIDPEDGYSVYGKNTDQDEINSYSSFSRKCLEFLKEKLR